MADECAAKVAREGEGGARRAAVQEPATAWRHPPLEREGEETTWPKQGSVPPQVPGRWSSLPLSQRPQQQRRSPPVRGRRQSCQQGH